MLTNRCSLRLSKILKEHRFPQMSIEFDSDYYDLSGNLLYNVSSEVEKNNLIFAPYIAEVIDRFEIDLDLYLSVINTKEGYRYRIYDPESETEILSNPNESEIASKVYEECIEAAINYYYHD